MESCSHAFRLFRVDGEGLFTTETQSSQRSEYFFCQKLLTPRLRGAISESCFTRKREEPVFETQHSITPILHYSIP
jgi:hypothetical protein